METLFGRYRNAMLLVAVLFLQLVMLAFQVKRDRDVPLIRVWAVGLITPIEKASSGAIRGVVGVWENYVDLRQAREESQQLNEEVARLKLVQNSLQEEALEARRLKTLLDFKGSIPSTTVVARVIGSSASETSRVLYIDKGSESGIQRNSAVITPDGIVGKVHRVFHGSSQVLVITDPDSGVGVLLQTSRLHGALRGIGGFFCQLRYITNDEKVEPGERVFTSGEDLVYPKGLPVGTVTAVKNGPIFKEITVQPAARLNRLEEVLVITRPVDQEILAGPEAAPPVAEEVPGRQPEGTSPPAGQPPASAALEQKAVPPPAPAALTTTRAKSETDADKMVEAYRAAQAAQQKTPEQRAMEGLLVPPAGPAGARKPAATQSAPGAGATGAAPAPAGASLPARKPSSPAATSAAGGSINVTGAGGTGTGAAKKGPKPAASRGEATPGAGTPNTATSPAEPRKAAPKPKDKPAEAAEKPADSPKPAEGAKPAEPPPPRPEPAPLP